MAYPRGECIIATGREKQLLLLAATHTSLTEAMRPQTVESLETLNTAISLVKNELNQLQLNYEQSALDAEKAGFHDQARTLRSQAEAVEIAWWKADAAVNALFIDVCDCLSSRPRTAEKVEIVKRIELPNVTPVAKVVEVVQ